MSNKTTIKSTISIQNKTHVVIKRKIAKLIQFDIDLEEVVFDEYINNNNLETVVFNINL